MRKSVKIMSEFWDLNRSRNPRVTLTEFIREIQDEAYNEAIDDALENVELTEDGGRCDHPHVYVDKYSILKLKKWTNK